jgi:hypothetical protein
MESWGGLEVAGFGFESAFGSTYTSFGHHPIEERGSTFLSGLVQTRCCSPYEASEMYYNAIERSDAVDKASKNAEVATISKCSCMTRKDLTERESE